MSRFVFLCVLVVLAAACAQPDERPVTLDEEAAQALAQGAQRLATALEDSDACAAMAEADAVAAQARDGVESGTVPVDVANEVEAVTEEVTADLVCEADEAPEEPDEPDEPEKSGEEREPKDEKDEEDEGDDEDDEGDDDGSRGEGPDGEGPPGQARAKGPGLTAQGVGGGRR